jgi:hypothetical protein
MEWGGKRQQKCSREDQMYDSCKKIDGNIIG